MTEHSPEPHPFESRPTRPRSRFTWQNWAGNVSAHPRLYAQPRSEAELRQLVLDAAQRGLRVRAVGAGHSFSAIAATDDVLVNLDHLSGLEHHDPASGEVTVWAGTRLYQLGGLLASLGRAQENMGDINHQSLAGAISTGTHGTGLGLGSIGTQVVALRLIDGRGQLRHIGVAQPEALSAARLSLGALGLITSVTLRTLPAYRLKMEIRRGRLDEMLALAPVYARAHRHFEFYWVPYTNQVQVKCSDPTDEPAQRPGPLQVFNDVVLENEALRLLSELNRAAPGSTRMVCGIIGGAITPNQRVRASHDIFGSLRTVKFREMEYAVPLEALPEALKALRELFGRHRFPISFPVEVRFARGDDILLSTAQGRDSGYIAIHAYQGVNPEAYFREAEAVFLAHAGRPHWGKCHTRSALELAGMYPHFETFRRLRDDHDPQRRFANAELDRVLGA